MGEVEPNPTVTVVSTFIPSRHAPEVDAVALTEDAATAEISRSRGSCPSRSRRPRSSSTFSRCRPTGWSTEPAPRSRARRRTQGRPGRRGRCFERGQLVLRPAQPGLQVGQRRRGHGEGDSDAVDDRPRAEGDATATSGRSRRHSRGPRTARTASSSSERGARSSPSTASTTDQQISTATRPQSRGPRFGGFVGRGSTHSEWSASVAI